MAKKKAKSSGPYRNFIRIAETGVVDDNGKARMSVGYRGRCVAKSDRPVECFVVTLMESVIESLGWSTREAAEKDFDAAIKQLQEYKKDIE